MEGLYLAGEPSTNSEASVILAFEPHPNIITDEWDPDYDVDLHHYYYYSNPTVHATFNQINMKTGSFSRVIRIISAINLPTIELSMNQLFDRNDYFGLIH